MWQLHRQGAGGIVGDEMGLGKTVQVCAMSARSIHVCCQQVSIGGVISSILNTDKIRLDRIQTLDRCQHFLERSTAAK